MFVAEIDGYESNSKKGFMVQMDNAFGFPPYFGENWDALWDCMKDLYWINENNFIIKITNSDQLTRKNKDKILSFLNELKEHWESPIGKSNYTLKIQLV